MKTFLKSHDHGVSHRRQFHFFHQIVQPFIKQNITAPCTLLVLSEGNYPVIGGLSHKGSVTWKLFPCPLQWRHNERDHRDLHCLFNCWFRRRSKKTLKLRVTGLCTGNSKVTGEFPAQRASNAENCSICWRYHVKTFNPLVWWPVCTHVNIYVTKWCIVRNRSGAFWNFCNRSIGGNIWQRLNEPSNYTSSIKFVFVSGAFICFGFWSCVISTLRSLKTSQQFTDPILESNQY